MVQKVRCVYVIVLTVTLVSVADLILWMDLPAFDYMSRIELLLLE